MAQLSDELQQGLPELGEELLVIRFPVIPPLGINTRPGTVVASSPLVQGLYEASLTLVCKALDAVDQFPYVFIHVHSLVAGIAVELYDGVDSSNEVLEANLWAPWVWWAGGKLVKLLTPLLLDGGWQ